MVEAAVEKLDGIRNIFHTVQHLEGRVACSRYSSCVVQEPCKGLGPLYRAGALHDFPVASRPAPPFRPSSVVAARCVHPFNHFLGKFFTIFADFPRPRPLCESADTDRDVH